jgi:transcriptional regulator with XRE-family HTH domain
MKGHPINTLALDKLMALEEIKNHACLAEAIGVDRSYISQLVHGKRNGSIYLLKALLQAFPHRKDLINDIVFFNKPFPSANKNCLDEETPLNTEVAK